MISRDGTKQLYNIFLLRHRIHTNDGRRTTDTRAATGDAPRLFVTEGIGGRLYWVEFVKHQESDDLGSEERDGEIPSLLGACVDGEPS